MSAQTLSGTHREVALSQGTVRYRDEGAGPPIVFVHGVLVHGGLWSKVVERLREDFRCIAPDWPFGSHLVPMAPDARLTPDDVADMVAELVERLDLGPVTLVGNDSGGAISQLVATRHPDRIERLVLTNCDAFDRFPPPMFGYLRWATYVPGAVSLLAQTMRLQATRRLPIAFGWLTHEPMDPDLVESFVRPSIDDREVRRDLKKFLRTISPRYTRRAAQDLPRFDKPVLLAWGRDDKFFPPELAERLAAILPNATLEWIEGARAFVPQDQPDRLAALMRQFIQT
jgi:pimeloyl-ACP methyl ester carboxylesterase